MKISDAHGSYLHQTYVNETSRSRPSDVTEGRSTGQGNDISRSDTIVSLSNSSRELRIAENAVESAPDTRGQKVQQLKQAIQEGRYAVDAEGTAEKLIGSIVDRFV